MNIAAGGSTLLQVATSASELRSRGLELRAGQRLTALVLLVSDDRVLVSLNGVPVVASSTLPLQEGQRLELTVGDANQQTVTLRLVDSATARVLSDPKAAGSDPRSAVRALTAHDLREALVAAGIVPSDEAMAAAQALSEHGLPVNQRNVQAIVRALTTGGPTALGEARVLAAARALGLEPTPDTIAALRQALAPDGGRRLIRALSDLANALEPATALLPPSGAEAPMPTTAVREALVEALGRYAATAPESDAAVRAAALLETGAPAPDLLAALAKRLGRIRLGPGASESLTETVALGRDLASLSKELAPLLDALRAALAVPSPAPRGGDPSDMAPQVWNAAEQLAFLAAEPDAPGGAIDNVLTALRTAAQTHRGPAGAGGASASAAELASRVASLLDQVGAALRAESPEGVARARELLVATLDRLDQGMPATPGDRLRLLQGALTRAAELIGPATGWDPPSARALGRQLVWLASELAKPESTTSAREAVSEAVGAAREAIAGLERAISGRRADLLSLLAGRVAAEATAVSTEHLASQVAELARLEDTARSALGLTPAGSAVRPAPAELLPALADALSLVARALPDASAPAAPTELPERMLQLAAAVSEALDSSGRPAVAAGVREAVASAALPPPTTDPVGGPGPSAAAAVPRQKLRALADALREALPALLAGVPGGEPAPSQPSPLGLAEGPAVPLAARPAWLEPVSEALARLVSALPAGATAAMPPLPAGRDLPALRAWIDAALPLLERIAVGAETPAEWVARYTMAEGSSRASLFGLVSGLAPLDDNPAVGAILAEALPALRASLVASVRESASSAAAILARMTATPREGSEPVARALREVAAQTAVSTEHRLLAPAPEATVRDDLRTHLMRLARDGEYLAALPEAEVEAPALVAALSALATAARSVSGLLEARQLLNAAYTAQQPSPLVAYIQLPIQVGDHQHMAELKLLRDPRQGAREIDPANATVAIRLDTKTLGLVVAVLRTDEKTVHVTFTLERSEYERAVAREAGSLQAGLERAGFRVGSLATEVRARSGEVFDRLGPSLPEGSTLSLLA